MTSNRTTTIPGLTPEQDAVVERMFDAETQASLERTLSRFTLPPETAVPLVKKGMIHAVFDRADRFDSKDDYYELTEKGGRAYGETCADFLDSDDG